jgi:hypothetical protein
MPTPSVTLTSSGVFQDAEGNALANGYIRLFLSGDASVSGGFLCGGPVATINLDSNGKVASGQKIWGTDVMTPSGLKYRAEIYKSTGQLAFRFPQNQTITGSTFDLSTWTPS